LIDGRKETQQELCLEDVEETRYYNFFF
jgi:hypothetical protein